MHVLLLSEQISAPIIFQPPSRQDQVGPRSESLNRLGPAEDQGLQTDVGLSLTEVTGGRYAALAASSGFSFQLESLAGEITRRQAELARQYRVIVTRPASLNPTNPLRVRVDRPDVRIQISPDGGLP